VANHTGSDTNEFVEVFYAPTGDLSNLTLLEIEGDGSGAGVIDGVWPLGSTDAAGFWTTGFLNNMIENGTMTLLLVYDFSGAQGEDIDTDDNGAIDYTPWSAVEDAIAVSDGDAGDHTYTTATLVAYYDGNPFHPGGASRIPNGSNTNSPADWVRNDFDGEGLPGFSGTPATGEALNTPGDVNELAEPPTDPIINEFVANHVGADDHEYMEIYGDPDTDYSGFRILVVEGDGANAGRVDAIRTPGTTNADGYWVTNFMSGVLENGSQTLLLVENSSVGIGWDLDTNNDGTMDTAPWGRLVDDVAVSDGDAGDQVYSASVLSPGFDGNAATPGGASRLPDATDTDSAGDWTRNDYDGEGLAGFTGTPEVGEALNTPGAMNDTALDTTPPIITVDLNRTVLWPPNHKLVEIIATVTVTDYRDPSPTFVLLSATSNEPDNDIGDGNTVDDIQIVDETHLLLRAERQGGGEGREYTLCYQASDAAGNTATMCVSVRVPHDYSGMALASAGFTPDGTDFAAGEERFAIVIPSQRNIATTDDLGNVFINSGFDATQIDAHHVYLGNSYNAVRAGERVVFDANGDNLDDVALFFSVAAVRDIQSALEFGEVYDNRIAVEERNWKEYGSIGLQFEAPDGTELKIEDIFKLGEPVPLNRDNGKPADNGTVVDPHISIHPNPFNPTTTVAFELAASEPVTVRVFDVSGRLVKTLADGPFAGGTHQLQWNGYDNRGTRVASGIYFIRIESRSYTATRRAVMLK
jgi:hypothetical protein